MRTNPAGAILSSTQSYFRPLVTDPRALFVCPSENGHNSSREADGNIRYEWGDRKAVAYLCSIVLNLARDHNRRGLVSLRHRLPADESPASIEDKIVLREDQKEVLDALGNLPRRQRDCLVLKYSQPATRSGDAQNGFTQNQTR